MDEISSFAEDGFVVLPNFLRRLEDANFHLLTDLSANPVRMAAIDIVGPAPAFCRVFELNVRCTSGTQSAQERLRAGIYPDDILFERNDIILERDIGDPEEEFCIVVSLVLGKRGQYFDGDLEPLQDSEAIADAVDELTRRGEVEWRPLE